MRRDPQAGESPAARELPIDLVQRGKYQPRRDMEPESLQELADSIQGPGRDAAYRGAARSPIASYEIIAGERRWRATQLAGLDAIPAVVRDVSDEAAIAMALIENIQREDLNPIEEAVALQRLQQEFELTQQEVAEAVGKSRSTVANLLRLMTLQEDVRRLLEHGDLEMGHARALLGLEGPDQSQAARTVVARDCRCARPRPWCAALLEAREKPPEPPKSAWTPTSATCRTTCRSAWGPEGADQARRKRQGQAGAELQQPGRTGRHSQPHQVEPLITPVVAATFQTGCGALDPDAFPLNGARSGRDGASLFRKCTDRTMLWWLEQPPKLYAEILRQYGSNCGKHAHLSVESRCDRPGCLECDPWKPPIMRAPESRKQNPCGTMAGE